MEELRLDSRTGRDDGCMMAGYIADGLIDEAKVDSLNGDHFGNLVSGHSVDTLDDGEAATLALAVEMSAVAVLDERKARRIAEVRYPGLLVASTIDILALDSVEKELGRVNLANAIYRALTDARMRVLAEHSDWVVALIGKERAVTCSSLPQHTRATFQHRAVKV